MKRQLLRGGYLTQSWYHGKGLQDSHLNPPHSVQLMGSTSPFVLYRHLQMDLTQKKRHVRGLQDHILGADIATIFES